MCCGLMALDKVFSLSREDEKSELNREAKNEKVLDILFCPKRRKHKFEHRPEKTNHNTRLSFLLYSLNCIEKVRT